MFVMKWGCHARSWLAGGSLERSAGAFAVAISIVVFGCGGEDSQGEDGGTGAAGAAASDAAASSGGPGGDTCEPCAQAAEACPMLVDESECRADCTASGETWVFAAKGSESDPCEVFYVGPAAEVPCGAFAHAPCPWDARCTEICARAGECFSAPPEEVADCTGACQANAGSAVTQTQVECVETSADCASVEVCLQ